MLTAGAEAQQRYGTNFAISGPDGVHPTWAGQTVMAYAFLKAFGVDGEIGTITIDLESNDIKASAGHKVISKKSGEFELSSTRYPFCACESAGHAAAGYPECAKDDPRKDTSIRSALALIPFNRDLNRLALVVKHGRADGYKVTWDAETKTFAAAQLAAGINLAEAFPLNPFAAAFARVDAAVAAKQAYETKQIKELFHGPAGKADMESVASQSESERAPLTQGIKAAFTPVIHTIRIEPQ